MSDNKLPLVSVIITNYNYAQYVGEAIESALNQTYKNIEIIVIDDGSTDNSPEVIRKYTENNKNIRYVRQKNKGVVFARNAGLEKAQGEFLLFLDGDDIFPSEYIETLEQYAASKSIDVVYTDYEIFGSDSSLSSFPDYDIEKLKRGNYIHISAFLRRSAIAGHKFDEALNKLTHEDWDFFLGIALTDVRIAKNSDTKLRYRAHSTSRSMWKDADAYRTQTYKLVKSTFYIVGKYKNIYPGNIDIYDDSEIVEWCMLSLDRLQRIHLLHKELDEKDATIDEKIKTERELRLELEDVKNSKSYRILKKVATIKNKIIR